MKNTIKTARALSCIVDPLIRATAWTVLGEMRAHDLNAVSARDLARGSFLSESTITEGLEALENVGQVRRNWPTDSYTLTERD